MNISLSVLTAAILCASLTTAFTVGRPHFVLSSQPQQHQQQQQGLQSTSQWNGPLRTTSSLFMNMADFAKSEINSNKVVVFSKSYCPYCTATKELFTDLGVDFKVHELDKMGDNGPALQTSLLKMTNQRTVPNVFVNGQHIGGNDDTQEAARKGKLQEMLGIAA